MENEEDKLSELKELLNKMLEYEKKIIKLKDTKEIIKLKEEYKELETQLKQKMSKF